MAVILHIETSSRICSVALSESNKILFEKINYDGPNHGKLLGVYVQDTLSECKRIGKQIDAVALSFGPGSYTGLRIGCSFAKGLCYGLDLPLIAIPTLTLIAKDALSKNAITDPNALICPMIDARRMEVYACVLDHKLNEIRKTAADIIDATSYADYLKNGKIYFIGDGASKCAATITHENAIFINDIYPLARNMVQLAEAQFEKKEFQDVAYCEPFYLKEFVATIAKNKVLSQLMK